MFLLYNGEYQEINLQEDYNTKQIQDALEKRKNLTGLRVGDFDIVTVDYDWGLHKQVNVAKCISCGEEKEIPNIRDFIRGKGVRRTCPCRNKKKVVLPLRERCRAQIGQEIGGFRLLAYQEGKGARIECTVCGKQKWAPGKCVLAGEEECNHKIPRDYSDPSYMGMRIGYLTVVERVGKRFKFRCDCGTEIIQRPTDVFRVDNVRTCGRAECPYHQKNQKAGALKRAKGVEFEKECAAMMERQGFVTQMTPESGDYGVDFFAEVDGEKVAFQCKRTKVASVVSAVQEVYAGGRYYDCCKFVVVSPSGFSYSAELMAAKLGVQLEADLIDFCLKDLEINRLEPRQFRTHSGRATIWEIDGVSKPAYQWCREYGLSRSCVMHRIGQGMDLKTALTAPKHNFEPVIIEIDGISKTKQEWCEHYGITPQLYDYRIKYSKMTPAEALTKEKSPLGRKRKAQVLDYIQLPLFGEDAS